MGKIVKYCSSCDEGFAERFGFCPDCGAPLQAFELNPITGQMTDEAEIPPAPEFLTEQVEGSVFDTVPAFVEPPFEPELEQAAEPTIDLEYDDSSFEETDREPEPTPDYSHSYTPAPLIDDGYHITVIEEKNLAQRNGLLLGASIFMIVFVLSATVYSLFTKTLGVNAIDDGTSLAFLIDEVPMDLEELEQKKDKDKSGGGGGSGNEEETPASRGDLADQSKTPTRPPNVNTMRSDTPMLQTPTTEGTMKFPKVYNKWGLPNGLDGLSSNGPGSGGGIGSGSGSGQGSGTGSGAGSGSGSGYGSGEGTGIGSGTGPGNSGGAPPLVAVTSPFRIIAKPKATYTDAARSNNVQGSVRLRIVLLASGQVGSITPVTRLPYGLTEQAIAAARQIRFEPKKVNGYAVSTTVTFEYSFNIY